MKLSSPAAGLFLKRLPGMMFPAKGAPVKGSKMVTGPFTKDCEKSPDRSASVGTVATFLYGFLARVAKYETKKKVLVSFSSSFGILSGPPTTRLKRDWA